MKYNVEKIIYKNIMGKVHIPVLKLPTKSFVSNLPTKSFVGNKKTYKYNKQLK